MPVTWPGSAIWDRPRSIHKRKEREYEIDSRDIQNLSSGWRFGLSRDPGRQSFDGTCSNSNRSHVLAHRQYDDRAKGHTATLLLDGRVLIVGGNSGNVVTAELYDPLTGTFSAIGSLSRAPWSAIRRRGNHRATLLQDGKTLITDESGHAELFDPVTNTFTDTGRMIVARPYQRLPFC